MFGVRTIQSISYLSALMCFAGQAVAQDDEGSWDDFREGWHVKSKAAVWFAGAEGSVGRGDYESDIDKSFSDLFEDLKLGLGVDVEVGNGPFTFGLFGQYYAFEVDATLPAGGDADVEANFLFIEPTLLYKFYDQLVGPSDQRLTLEAGGGLRYTHVSVDIDVNEGRRAGTSFDRDADFVDPLIAARGTFEFNRNFNVSVAGTVGGFGVGSDFAWSAVATAEYRFTRKFGVVAGYRALDYDYDSNLDVDLSMHGPFVGMSFRW